MDIMPLVCLQINGWKVAPPLVPTMTDPSAFTALGIENKAPGSEPMPTTPVAAVHRNAWERVEASSLVPTTTAPFALTASALLLALPGRKPRPTMPVPAVHRNAWFVLL